MNDKVGGIVRLEMHDTHPLRRICLALNCHDFFREISRQITGGLIIVSIFLMR